ncbi:MAG: restriction endonuclease subunit S [Chloroflexi bacterium]|nr:restriction endonuclease subunit S [Chloroflexota bacterium]MDE2709981.1 restriction endonuclease subunit S [Chloroflexota bacterium]
MACAPGIREDPAWRSYPAYRASGIDWLGAVPGHWSVRHLGLALASVIGGGTPQTSREDYWSVEGENGLAWVAIGDMSDGGTVRQTEKRVTPDGVLAARLRALPAGTVIYSMYASVGAVARLGIPATTNQAILGLIPANGLLSCYLYWWLHAIRQPVLSLTRDNTQSNLNAETVRGFPVCLPPLDEQRDIAAFLDRETERIDSLIAKKRLLIERLQEYRTALITRTVTRGLPPEAARAAGLDPSPRLKPLGVVWLGDVPEHWDVGHLKRWFMIVNGGTPKGSEESFWDGEVAWLTPDDLGRSQTMWIGAGNRSLTLEGLESCSARLCPDGSIALSTRAPIGHVAIMSASSATNQGRRTLVPGPQMDSEFAFFAMSAARRVLESLGQGSTFMELGQGDLGSLPLARPPLAEQRVVVDFLKRESERIAALLSCSEDAIERLQEYRTALITAAVTGKIDVRDQGSVTADLAE